MLSLGGNTLGFADSSSSSASKGESVADTVSVVSGYADIIAMRHPKEGAPIVAAKHSLVPVINAGDGGHYHPTQALTDLMTIHEEKGSFDNLTVGFAATLSSAAPSILLSAPCRDTKTSSLCSSLPTS